MPELKCFSCGKIYKRKYSWEKHTITCQQKNNNHQTNNKQQTNNTMSNNTVNVAPQTLLLGDLDELISDIKHESFPVSKTEDVSSQKNDTPCDLDSIKLAEYNPDDSPKTQCRNLYKFINQFVEQTNNQIAKLQENHQNLLKVIKNLERPQVKPNVFANAHNLPEKIKQMFANQKNYDKPDVSSLDLSPQKMLELYNLHGENIIDELIKMIWFNKNIPQNYSVFLLNSAVDEVLYYRDGWRKDRFKNIVALLLAFLDNFIGIGFTNHLTVHHTSFTIQAKRAREQFMNVRQSFKNPITTKGVVPPYIAVYYEKIKDLVELMTEEIVRGQIQ